MKVNYKLFTLPIIVLFALIYISFLFSSEIDRLKAQIDNIYFGNFIPVHKLHIIKDEYKNIINKKPGYNKSKTIILKNWDHYNSQYKTEQERLVVNKINKQVQKSFKKKSASAYKHVVTQIELLIQYEVSSASNQRKIFLEKYDNVRNYLFYNQVFIIIFTAIFLIISVISFTKNYNRVEYLMNKYKSDSVTDGLTGLYNRKYFDTTIDEIISASYDNDHQSAFVMIDIDFFKQFNDTYGHDAGDIALKTVANVLDTLFSKEYDYVFRLGGEEFGIIVYDIKQKELEERLKTLQNAIAAQKIKHSASKTGILTLSMGVVMIDDETYSFTRTELYKLADKKLYQSKEHGRNQYTI